MPLHQTPCKYIILLYQYCTVPSASRGDQCPEGAQGRGEEELDAYCSRTLPSVHLSHTDPNSLGNQHTSTATNLDTGQVHITYTVCKDTAIKAIAITG